MTLKDSAGAIAITTTDNRGNYSLDISTKQFPVMLKVLPDVPGAIPLFSAATSSGTANITPLTDLSIYEGLGRVNLADIFLQGDFSKFKDVIELGKAVVISNFVPWLQGAGVDPGVYDVITTPMLANGSGVDAVLDKVLVNTSNQSVTVTDNGDVPQNYNPIIEFEDPALQRKAAAALFNDPSILLCDDDSVSEYNRGTCGAKYNYNLLGMPGCWAEDGSNYIGYYQNINGIDWKSNAFYCPPAQNAYKTFKWKAYNGTANGTPMDGTHNGIDFLHRERGRKFYAVSAGILIRADTF